MYINKHIYCIINIFLITFFIGLYFYPIFMGSKLSQPDILNHIGSASEVIKYRDNYNTNIYWTNRIFSGMPTYQMGVLYEFDLIKKIDSLLRIKIRPLDYIILLIAGSFFLSYYILRKVEYAIIHSIFFSFCSYFFQIIAAGHNSKLHTICYFCPSILGFLFIYNRRYLLGIIITTFFLGLQISCDHLQMIYYFFIILFIFFLYVIICNYKNYFFILKFLLASFISIILSLGLNFNRLYATYKYSEYTSRKNTELNIIDKKLYRDYITNWSYGKTETFNLLIPNFKGGSSRLNNILDLNNYINTFDNLYKNIINDTQYKILDTINSYYVPSLYWGDQPGTAGPAYQGVLIIFLVIISLFIKFNNKYIVYRNWIWSCIILSILLSWGHNFSLITNFFIDNIPFYSKFRAVSSILVITEFSMPLLAIITLYNILDEKNYYIKFRIIFIIYIIFNLFLLILFLYSSNIFSFLSKNDLLNNFEFVSFINKLYNKESLYINNTIQKLLYSLKLDRILLFKKDILRTLFYLFLSFLPFIYFFYYKKNNLIIFIYFSILCLVDLYNINIRYFNKNNYIDSSLNDKSILYGLKNNKLENILYELSMNDKTYYRVYNKVLNTFNESFTSNFVNSIGGYHGAKLRRYQDLIDIYFYNILGYNQKIIKGVNNVLNMLNVKYIVQGDQLNPILKMNNNILGNAWFIKNVHWVNNADEEILSLMNINPKYTAIFRSDKNKNIITSTKGYDNTAKIELIKYSPNNMKYISYNKYSGIGIFSDIYYPDGWEARIDGKKVNINCANYILRSLYIPPGKHIITFSFKPNFYYSNKIVYISNFIFIFMIILYIISQIIKKINTIV